MLGPVLLPHVTIESCVLKSCSELSFLIGFPVCAGVAAMLVTLFSLWLLSFPNLRVVIYGDALI
jgi:hypothetical protein